MEQVGPLGPLGPAGVAMLGERHAVCCCLFHSSIDQQEYKKATKNQKIYFKKREKNQREATGRGEGRHAETEEFDWISFYLFYFFGNSKRAVTEQFRSSCYGGEEEEEEEEEDEEEEEEGGDF